MLDPKSPLFQTQGVRYIFHILGPNMNPSRPNCLSQKPKIAEEYLELCYTNLFETFYKLYKGSDETLYESSDEELIIDDEIQRELDKLESVQPKNAFQLLMSQSKNNNSQTYQKLSKPKIEEENTPSFGWSGALLDYCLHPEKHQDSIEFFDDDIVVIKDKFPKAKLHFLVMPRKKVNGFKELKSTDLELLKKLKQGGEVAVSQKKFHHPYKLGFHAVPSMSYSTFCFSRSLILNLF